MKEFAELEQKAKRYDEALEKAKRLYEKETITESLCHIFPELKESEDEKIRKGIIDFLWKEKIFLQEAHSSVENNPKYRFVMDAIAWLEKQSGNNIKWNKNTKDNKPQVNHSVLMQTINGIAEGEWQGEQWHQYRWAGIVRDSDVLSWIELSDIEKQGEQKPADKPKFHKGEWIVWQDKCYKVNYNGCGYELVDQNGLSTSLEYETVEESAHLWTIQDAKKGDVLYSPCLKLLWIFKDKSSVYCGCNLIYNNGAFSGEGYIEKPTGAIPATKEQRDLLFQKMKEAGYEWSDKEKQLKEIENEIEISFGAKDSELQEATDHITKGFLAEMDKDKVVIKKGKKPAWSEEDEKNLQGILDEIEADKSEAPEYDIDTYNRFIDWLKALKQRIGG